MDAPSAAFAACVLALGAQRIAELLYARHTARALERAGARLVRDDGMGLIVLVHVAFFAGVLLEGALGGVRIGWWTAVGGLAFLAGEALRASSMVALGPRWSTRVYVLPQAPLVARGPYRFLRHPIYVGVALELAGFPLAFGLWWTAALVSLVHLPVLLRRIRKEERALGLGRAA